MGFLLHLLGPTESLMLEKASKFIFSNLFSIPVRTAGKGLPSPGIHLEYLGQGLASLGLQAEGEIPNCA